MRIDLTTENGIFTNVPERVLSDEELRNARELYYTVTRPNNQEGDRGAHLLFTLDAALARIAELETAFTENKWVPKTVADVQSENKSIKDALMFVWDLTGANCGESIGDSLLEVAEMKHDAPEWQPTLNAARVLCRAAGIEDLDGT